MTLSFASRGVRSSVLRLPPISHRDLFQGRQSRRGAGNRLRSPRAADPARPEKAVIIFEDIATAQLSHGSVNEAAQTATNSLAILRETEFAMWLPRYAAIAQGLVRWQRQPQVRAHLEEFAMTKRQFAASPR